MLMPFPQQRAELDEELEMMTGLRVWRPVGEPGDWERCQCMCHRHGGTHVVACCHGGWKKTFQLLGKELRELQAREAQARQTAVTYRPAHGGYPG